MKLFSFFTDEFLDMKLTEKEIEQRKNDMKGDGFPTFSASVTEYEDESLP